MRGAARPGHVELLVDPADQVGAQQQPRRPRSATISATAASAAIATTMPASAASTPATGRIDAAQAPSLVTSAGSRSA